MNQDQIDSHKTETSNPQHTHESNQTTFPCPNSTSLNSLVSHIQTNPTSPILQNLPPIFQPTLQANTKLVTRSQHEILKQNQIYYGIHTHVTKSPLPKNPVYALKDPNWKMTIDDEYNSLNKNEMWDLVPWPPNVNVIQSMWILDIKKNMMVLLRGIKPDL